VQLIPDDAGQRWQAAAQQLQDELRGVNGADGDCKRVLIRVAPAPDSPSVEVTTQDGRRAVRLLASVTDLGPTVAALVVTIAPEPRPPGDEDRSTAAIATGAPAVGAANRAWHLVLAGSAGARLRFGEGAPRPALSLAVGAIHGGWEWTVLGGWSSGVPPFTQAIATGADPPLGPVGNSLDLSVTVARRVPISKTDLLLGLGAGAARLSPTSVKIQESGAPPTMDSFLPVIEPLVEAFVAASIPVWSLFRLRSQLLFQWAIPTAEWANTTANSNSTMGDVWTPPYAWTAGLTIGVETRVP
jgi:hypothetical protein